MAKALREITKGIFIASIALFAAAAFSVIACSQSDSCTENTVRMYQDGTYADGITGSHFLAGIVVAIDNAD
jgi:hypothetical protein